MSAHVIDPSSQFCKRCNLSAEVIRRDRPKWDDCPDYVARMGGYVLASNGRPAPLGSTEAVEVVIEHG